MDDDIAVDVEVEVEVDTDELEIERDDAELVEASYEAGGIEIDVEAEVETHGRAADTGGSDDETADHDDEGH